MWDGIERPNLYKLGFSHNNCGGFCFSSGIGHFKNLLEKKPDLYKYHKRKEEELRNYLEREDRMNHKIRIQTYNHLFKTSIPNILFDYSFIYFTTYALIWMLEGLVNFKLLKYKEKM